MRRGMGQEHAQQRGSEYQSLEESMRSHACAVWSYSIMTHKAERLFERTTTGGKGSKSSSFQSEPTQDISLPPISGLGSRDYAGYTLVL